MAGKKRGSALNIALYAHSAVIAEVRAAGRGGKKRWAAKKALANIEGGQAEIDAYLKRRDALAKRTEEEQK